MSRAFVCRCEDIDAHELEEAIRAGYADLESLRRFTALGTGPCQGKACIAECARLLASHHGVTEGDIGMMTLRPPVTPIPLGLLAALDDADVEALMDGPEADASRRLRSALEDPRNVRTGRPTPRSTEGEP